MIVQRFTVASSFAWSGLGLHSGKDVTVTVHPGEAGLWFRSDSGRWEAIPENVSETSRCTRLGEVSTIEHLMSALAVHEITDAEIEVTGGELPAIDGSAKVFYDDLHAVGRTGLGERTLPDLFSRVFLQDDLVKIAIAKGVGRWRYEFSRENRWPFYQEAEIESFASYGTEIAPARTFGFEEEVPAMIAAGLARGLDKSSALVIKEDGYRHKPIALRAGGQPLGSYVLIVRKHVMSRNGVKIARCCYHHHQYIRTPMAR